MRINDIIVEAESGTINAKEIDRHFKKLGYKKLGTGADATVYAKDEKNVIKILMPEDPTAQAEKVFAKFHEFAEYNKDIVNLPKFNSVSKFKVGDSEYTLINMERLFPIKNNSFQEAMVWILSDLATEKIDWNQALETIKNEQTWKLYSGKLPFKRILQYINSLNTQQLKEYELLFTLMSLLYNTGRINKIGWDLHTENVMQRSDGTLVIIDPWFSTVEGM
jgi:hypothetical protein